MPWWRKTLLYIARFALRSVILLGITSAVFAGFFGNRILIDKIITDSGAYEQVSDNIVREISKLDTEENNVPVTEPEIQAVFDRAFSPEKLKAEVSKVSDGVYRWLDGTSPRLDFTVDISDSKKIIVDGIVDYAIKRMKSLPTCTTVPETNDPFKAECQPPGLDYDAQAKNLSGQLYANKKFLPQTKFTPADFKNLEGETLEQALADLPPTYQFAVAFPMIALYTSLALAAVIILLDGTKMLGVKRVGRILLSSGIFLFIIFFLFGRLLPYLFASLQPEFTQGTGLEFLNKILVDSTKQIVSLAMLYSAAVMIVGAGLLLAIWISKGRLWRDTIRPPKNAEPQESAPIEDLHQIPDSPAPPPDKTTTPSTQIDNPPKE